MSADCIFCSIAAGEVPAEIIYEAETVIGFRDLQPQAPTHVLLISRSHYPNAESLAAAEPMTAAHLFDAAREVAAAEGLASGYRMVLNTGPDAHQTVFHVHLHLLGGRPMGWPPG